MALREIYLRGFEIAVKRSQPMALMTSYNLINGVHAPNSGDLCAKVLRSEWQFDGLVVTDWKTTGDGGSSPVDCIKSRNDLIMPGSRTDIRLLLDALSAKGADALDPQDLKRCVADIIRVVWQSLAYEDSVPYTSDHKDPTAFFTVREK